MERLHLTMPGRRRAIAATALGMAAVLSALLVATGTGRGLVARVGKGAKAAASDLRRDWRERRAAERLAEAGVKIDPGPDERLPVTEPILDVAGGLSPGWIELGRSRHDIARGRPARLDLSNLGGLLLARPGLSGWYGGLLLRYRAPESCGDFLEVRLEEAGGRQLRRVRLPRERAIRASDGSSEVWIPMSELNPGARPFERVALYAWRRVGAEGVELDELALTAAPPPRPQPARPAHFVIDCRSAGTGISPLIYGIGTYFVDEGPQQWTMGATARRWGGNHASRYNWQIQAWNKDRDWFFRNSGVRSAESFLEENRDRGVRSALTVPILGWVAKDATSYSFPVSRFGPQQAVAWDYPDAGNGVRPDGTSIPSPSPSTTSVACPPECIERWVRRLREAATGGGPGVDSYILDNEPMLWSGTHRDVHPEPLGYDELLARTVAYASAIRRADPEARIAGPAEWGWLNLHYSAKDVAASVWLRPDRLRHWNVPLLPWYLRELRKHEERTGVRLVDVVDVHFYPAADPGVGTAGGTDPATAALRIRSTRSLWDPTYVDESWVDEPIRLLPLLRKWIVENYPGREISLGEWSFGAENHMSGALATAEALGRFGVEGVHSAYHWTYPPDRSPTYWAFRAYRNFDGEGGRFLDRSAPVTGSGELASLFASLDGAGRHLVAVLLNLAPASPLDVEVDLDGCGPASVTRVFTYAGGPDGFRARASPSTVDGKITLGAEPYSITVIELTFPLQGKRADPHVQTFTAWTRRR